MRTGQAPVSFSRRAASASSEASVPSAGAAEDDEPVAEDDDDPVDSEDDAPLEEYVVGVSGLAAASASALTASST